MKITATENIVYRGNSVMQKGQTITSEQLGEHLMRLFESRRLAVIEPDENKMITEAPKNKAVHPARNKNTRAKGKSKKKSK